LRKDGRVFRVLEKRSIRSFLVLVVAVSAASMLLSSCAVQKKKELAPVSKLPTKDDLLTTIHTREFDGDCRGVRTAGKKFLSLYGSDAASEKVALLVAGADIKLKLYEEAEEILKPIISGGSLKAANANALMAEIHEGKGDYKAACYDALTALKIGAPEDVRSKMLTALEKLAPLVSENNRRNLINQFYPGEGVDIIIRNSMDFAVDVNDTASVRKLSSLLRGIKSEKSSPAPFPTGKVVIEKKKESGSGTIHRIGLLCPITGRLSAIGKAFLHGVSIAAEELKATRHMSVEIIAADTNGDPLIARNSAEELIAREKVDAIVGAVLSSTTISAAEVAQLNGVAFLSTVATEEGISNIGDWIFQMNRGTETETIACAEVACRVLHLKRIAFLAVADPHSYRLERLFKSEVERRGGVLCSAEFYEEGTTDFKESIEKIRSAAPEGLFIASDTEDLILILPQLSFYEFGVQLIGLSNWNAPRLFKMVARDMEGAVFPDDFFSQDEKQALINASALISEPVKEVNPFVLGGYEGVITIADAMEKSSSSGHELREELEKIMNNRRHSYLKLINSEGIPFFIVLDGEKRPFVTIKAPRQ